jgi:hypothetical protein
MRTLENNYIGFKNLCDKGFDGLYDPNIPEEDQCSGYHTLKHMVVNNIRPASLEEIERWENSPTMEEVMSPPDIKYLRFLHPNLRIYVIKYWDDIRRIRNDTRTGGQRY